ncbi:Crp/Fnr family transcriptional regulator [Streptomyces sp. A3M-1-3]|uniref:Crp/Fnr family transcriptional regulator n=1 Tax=Streptomyces sp. A3M-1-3 TaxID=2962044 RepID=UPI0027E3EA36|nr:Crp/Fnr family transcriptional regulator [Streptomyces sp. A3M-1-3]
MGRRAPALGTGTTRGDTRHDRRRYGCRRGRRQDLVHGRGRHLLRPERAGDGGHRHRGTDEDIRRRRNPLHAVSAQRGAFILKRGRVRVFRVSADGRALTTAIITPGTIFGEMVLLGQHMYDNYAEALDDVTVCVMSRADVNRLLLTDPRIAARITAILGRRLSDLEQRLSDSVFKTVAQRIATTLTTLTTAQPPAGPLRPGGRHPQIALTHEQLAALAGTSRETCTKVLREYADQGMLRLARGRITVLDTARLKDAAG